MTTVTNTNHGAIAMLISQGKDFRNGGESFTGQRVSWTDRRFYFGRLSTESTQLLQDDIRTYGVDYVIFSYSTPIAWHVPTGTDKGMWRVPTDSHSVTTARHQSHVWSILRKLGIDTHFEWLPDISPITGRPLKSRSHREQTLFTAA